MTKNNIFPAVDPCGHVGAYSTPTATSEKQPSTPIEADKYPTLQPDIDEDEAVVSMIESKTDVPTTWREAEGADEPPTDGLHDDVVAFIASMCAARRIPREFVIAPMMAAISAAAGSRVKVHGAGYTNQLNVFAAVIAPSSSNKSRPAKDIMQPLEVINKDLFARAKREREEYETAKDERAKAKQKKSTSPEQPPLERPKQHQLIVSNITEESRITLLADNAHGILQYNDELDTFVTNIGKYTKSNELGELITIHDSGNIIINRIGREAVLLEYPYFSLFGTIQPRIAAKRLATEDGYLSGFTPRFLLFQPTDIDYTHKAQTTSCETMLRHWATWIDTIYKTSSQSSTDRTLAPSEGAAALHEAFMIEGGQIKTNADDDNERSIVGKLEISVWKLAAIAHVINDAAQGSQTNVITPQEMAWAISTCKYCYRRQMALISLADLAPKTTLKDVVLSALKAKPDVNMAELARVLGMSESTVRSIKHRANIS